MRILVLGAGAVGGYIGGRLSEAGRDVTFLLRPARAAQVGERGLSIVSSFGDATVKPRVLREGEIATPFDLVLLACKAYDLESAIAAIGPAVGPESTILPVLNGVKHFERLDECFGPETILYGTSNSPATLLLDGTIMHLRARHTLSFGERDGSMSQRVQRIAGVLANVKIESNPAQDIVQLVWEKFAQTTALAAITCLMRANIGQIMATNEGESLILEMIEECGAVAEAEGQRLRPPAFEHMRGLFTEHGSEHSASMERDVQQGGRVESDHLVGDMLRRARLHGVPTPLLRVAASHLQAYEIRGGYRPETPILP